MNYSGSKLPLGSFLFLLVLTVLLTDDVLAIRFPDRISNSDKDQTDQLLKTAVFALGSFWRSEAVFGCLNGVVRTTVGYAGGSKNNPEYRSLADHAESVMVSSLPVLILASVICTGPLFLRDSVAIDLSTIYDLPLICCLEDVILSDRTADRR